MFSANIIRFCKTSGKYSVKNVNKLYSHTWYCSKCCCFCSVPRKNELTDFKKDILGPYPAAYEPKEVESGWYEWWEKNKFFNPDLNSKHRKENKPSIFRLALPPPNVTGNLHIGHTLTVAIQDCISRWRRMRGETVYWFPGYDHGGIATQTVVEKKLFKERNLNRHDLGKEVLLKEINDWRTQTQKNIEMQLKKLGSSLDFTRTSFTMDENASKAVTKVFIQLFEDNLIYRKEKLVNWSSEIRSVISDIEVDHVEIPGKTKIRIPGLADPVELGLLDYFYYPIANSSDKILLATTRLETMLGDSAVAVNPNDSRHSHLVGKWVAHPYTGEHLPIIADESINKDFGSGVLKVTPGHDFKDFELAEKHKLKFNDILNDDGTINQEIENFKGKHRLIVRQLLRDSLSNKGLFKESKSHALSIPFCSRTGDIVEPRLKEQWYLDCTDMGRKAVKDVQDGKLYFVPDYHQKVWHEWFKNLKDWCISRQLWWGHQIPAYRISVSSDSQVNYWIAASSKEEAIQKASEKYKLNPESVTAVQDNDVLDTWFSSALYPLTAVGWPSEEENLNKYYPLSLMETGFDILFFWVARMVMLGQHLTGKLPFNEVLLHGMVCDAYGRKMTKSLGNTVDPLDIIHGISLEDLLERTKESQGILTPEEQKAITSGYKHNFPNGIPECGTDGLRFSLLSHDIQSQKINIDIKSIRTCRHFCNKIWQGIRLFTKIIENCPKTSIIPLTTEEVLNLPMNDVDRWILSRLAGLVAVSNSNFERHEFHLTAAAVRQFWVQNFCDVYLEYVKATLATDDEKRLFFSRVMLTCIETFLRVIAPMMPFLAEELYQRLPSFANVNPAVSVCVASYPLQEEYLGWRNTMLEADLHTITELIEIARSLKARHGATKVRPPVTIAVEDENTFQALNPFSNLIVLLAKLESVTFHLTQGQEFFEHHPQDTWVFQNHDHGISVIMDLGEMSGIQRENQKNKLERIRLELNKLNKMLSHSGYRKNASLSVQEKTMAKKAALEGELQKLLSQNGKSELEKKKLTFS
ncbi:valine--tRNA ligase-like [Uloborus diversus]|uniref:valine--tRNA ligase-like n=1 Tax=Uloborus diversus TaxID=327109 RepID=UPI002409BB09|nr:valine--tRNA ligase-like [Uloborus diversus]